MGRKEALRPKSFRLKRPRTARPLSEKELAIDHSRQNSPPLKPFLKWAGGKRQLLPEILKLLPNNIGDFKYYEPFLGAGALFFELAPRRAAIGDHNQELVAAYRAIRDDVDELVEALTEHQANHGEEYYYKVRELDRDGPAFGALSDAKRAARLIYLNKACFNGLYRVNSKGFFNVPFGRHAHPLICDEHNLRRIHRLLNRKDAEIEILGLDFEAAVASAGPGSFVYFDPPYHSPNKANFTDYQAGGFDESEQRRLRDVFAARAKAGALCLLSNSDAPFIRQLYGRFEIVPVKAKRAINSDKTGRGEVGEVLVKNWK
ncbi:MAG: DNA adenine methylase [Deltaproteobacteria bacterium]|nr:DNA adenine methylase [Deltaproteobacteria bacterium]